MKPILLILLVLLTACGAGRKASRQAAQAQKHLARAVWLDPSLASPTQVMVEVSGDTAQAPPMAFVDPHADSLYAACQAFAAEMSRERNYFAHRLMAMPAAAKEAVRKVQQVACEYLPYEFNHELFALRAHGGSSPGVEVVVHPRAAMVPCPPRVSYTPIVKVGVAAWYRWGFWILLALLLIGGAAVAFALRVVEPMVKTAYRE